MSTESARILEDPISVVEALGDEYSLRILNLLTEDKVSAKKLSENLDIPIATVYRRIDDLESANLIEATDRVLTEEGKRVTQYNSKVSQVNIYLSGDSPRVEVKKRSGPETAIDAEWENIKGERD